MLKNFRDMTRAQLREHYSFNPKVTDVVEVTRKGHVVIMGNGASGKPIKIQVKHPK